LAPTAASVGRHGGQLFVLISVPVVDPKTVTRGSKWTEDDGAEFCFQGKTADGKPVTWVIHGFAGGKAEISSEAGAPAAAALALLAQVTFRAAVGAKGWEAEWSIPLAAFGVAESATAVPFNLGAFRSEDRQWLCWVGTEGANWQVEKAGVLRLP
jgi:hypothetical protein